jgi:hypothetical protein
MQTEKSCHRRSLHGNHLPCPSFSFRAVNSSPTLMACLTVILNPNRISSCSRLIIFASASIAVNVRVRILINFCNSCNFWNSVCHLQNDLVEADEFFANPERF